MKKKQYEDGQIIRILEEAESGVSVKELCRKHGMSDATFSAWAVWDSRPQKMARNDRTRPDTPEDRPGHPLRPSGWNTEGRCLFPRNVHRQESPAASRPRGRGGGESCLHTQRTERPDVRPGNAEIGHGGGGGDRNGTENAH